MARKIRVDSSNTVAIWVQKTNAMSDYMGDLDNLSSVFDSDLGDPLFPDQDSNFVASLNHIGWLGPTVNNVFFGTDSVGGRSISQTLQVKSNIIAESADFDKMTIQLLRNNDSSMLAFQDDSDFFADSNQVGFGLHFDFNADSATFGNITVHDSHNIDTLSSDSIQIGNVLIGGTGSIGKLSMDDSSQIVFLAATIHTTPDTQTFDSVLVTNVVHVDSFIMESGGDSGFVVDSAYIDRLVYPTWDSIAMGDSFGAHAISAHTFSINKMEIYNELQVDSISINRLIIDGKTFDSAELFIMGDSTGTAIFGAYRLGESA